MVRLRVLSYVEDSQLRMLGLGFRASLSTLKVYAKFCVQKHSVGRDRL